MNPGRHPALLFPSFFLSQRARGALGFCFWIFALRARQSGKIGDFRTRYFVHYERFLLEVGVY